MTAPSSLTLQLLDETHLDDLTQLANDPQVSATSSVPHPCTSDEVREWIADNGAMLPPKLTYAILSEGRVAGAASLKHINYEERHAELSYWVGRPHWGLGIAGRAAHLLRDLALQSGQYDYLIARCLKINNPYSQRIILRLGFERDMAKADREVMGRWGEAFPGDAWQHYHLTRAHWLTLQAAARSEVASAATSVTVPHPEAAG